VDVATVPDRKSFPKRLLIAILCFFVGGIVAISWVLFSDSLTRLAPEDQAKMAEMRTLVWKRGSER
jgi:uncharacterized protein involved in exopolysaccharide biosynthesis